VVLSAGPGTHPIGSFDIELPRPRDVAAIRALPEFARLHALIWATMKDEVLRGYTRQMQGVAP
jgi:NitT/TauT family transport system ATP-binding protein